MSATVPVMEEDVVEHDDGAPRKMPERLCIVSRQRLPISELVRFVASPEGEVTPDLKCRLPGRGVWVEAKRVSIELAIKRKAFARGLKTEVQTTPALAQFVENLLETAALQSMSLANKAGSVVAGQSKVEAEMAGGHVVAVFHALDAAEDSKRKIRQSVTRRFGLPEDGNYYPAILTLFTSSQMSLCLGREHVIHACLVKSPAARTCLEKCLLLLNYRGLSAGQGP